MSVMHNDNSDEAHTTFEPFLALKRVVDPRSMTTFNLVNEKMKLSWWKNKTTNTLNRSGVIDF